MASQHTHTKETSYETHHINSIMDTLDTLDNAE